MIIIEIYYLNIKGIYPTMDLSIVVIFPSKDFNVYINQRLTIQCMIGSLPTKVPRLIIKQGFNDTTKTLFLTWFDFTVYH